MLCFASDREEAAAIGFGEATVALSKVGADREGCAIELVHQKSLAAIEAVAKLAHFVGEVDRFLVDEEILELKSHRDNLNQKGTQVPSAIQGYSYQPSNS